MGTKTLMVGALVFSFAFSSSCRAADRVTILYDAIGDSTTLTKDWGFSALIEHDGKRILFDTGNNGEIFERNVKTLGVDLRKLDFVVISHRHTDHMSGLEYVLKTNPSAKVYVPTDGPNGFGGAPLPPSAFRAEEQLPSKMRYFDGKYPEQISFGKLDGIGNFVLVSKTIEVAPGIFLVRTVSEKKGQLELPELTLAIKRANGLMLVDGCSHSGIEAILDATRAVETRTEIVFGGLHLISAPVEEIEGLVTNLRTKWNVQKIAPGHCTGEPAFARLKKAYGENYIYAGLGTRIDLQ